MKKVMRKILNALTLTAMVLVMALSVVAFTATSGNANADKGPVASSESTSAQVGDVLPSEEAEEETIVALSGIFKFTRELTFNDIYYADLSGLLEYFDTKDLNGVYDAVKPHGFDAFLDEITTAEDGMMKAIYFDNNKAVVLKQVEGDENAFISYDGENNQFTISEVDGKITTSIDNLTIELDEESGIPSLFYQFTYENEGEVVRTPLYVKVTLDGVAFDSTKIESGTEYAYKAGSCSMTSSNESPIPMSVKIKALADMLGIEVEEGKDAAAVIEEKFASVNIVISENAQRIIVHGALESNYLNFNFTFADENGLYVYNTASVKVVSHTFNFTENVDVITFEIAVDENTVFNFTFTSTVVL